VLARLIDDRPDFDLAEARLDNPFGLVLPMDLFGALLFQITGQQLSSPGDWLPLCPALPGLRAAGRTVANAPRRLARPLARRPLLCTSHRPGVYFLELGLDAAVRVTRSDLPPVPGRDTGPGIFSRTTAQAR